MKTYKALVLAVMVAACSGCAALSQGAAGLSQGAYNMAMVQPQQAQVARPVNCTTTYFRNQAYTTCR